jgi:Protein of unknown function (DUF4089)
MKRARKRQRIKAKATKERPTIKKPAKSRTKARKAARTLARTNLEPLDDLIAAAAQALDLKVERAWEPAIRANLRVIFNQLALVNEFELPDDIEPAPVFEA